MIHQLIVYSIIAIFIGISQSAGIGGGPVLNICLMLGLGYDAKKSMSIAYIFLMGGALASMWKARNMKNPKTKRPLIDYNLVLLTLPSAVSGSLFGTILNHFISNFIITILFSILLSYLFFNSYQKFVAFKRLEGLQSSTEKVIEQIQLQDVVNGEAQYIKGETQSRLKQIISYQNQVYPRDKLKVVIEIFVYTIIILFFKGGQSYNSFIGLEKCGFGSWICVAIHFILSYLYTKSIAIRQYRLYAEKQRLGFVCNNSSDKMSETKMNSCMLSGFFAGTAGGALGLGGAIILVPVWLNKGIDKNIAVNSSPPLIFFSAVVSFTLGLLSSKYTSFLSVVFYFVLAFISSYAIKEFIAWISERFGLKAMIYILLIITMISSLATLIPFEISNFINDPEEFMRFERLC